MNENLLIVCGGNPRDKKTWSGTPATMIEILESKGVTITDHNMFDCVSRIRYFFLKVYSKLFYYRIYARSPFLSEVCTDSLYKVINKTGINKVLFIAENISVQLPKTESYIYLDALLEPLLQYPPYDRDNKKIGFAWFYSKYKRQDVHSFQSATHIFTQNEWSKKYLTDIYGIESNKITNVGFGVNLTPLLAKKEYDENLLLIVLRKGVERLKGLNLLLDAFRIAKKDIPNLKLAVVGTELEPEEGVTYYYNQPRNVTVELFQRCSLYVMPALCEPNGVTYLEALANKSPIVGLNRFAFPEFAGYGKYGFICEHEDPKELSSIIVDALKDKTRLARMGEEGQRFVHKRYSWNLVLEEMSKIIFPNY